MDRRDFLKMSSMTALLAAGGLDGIVESLCPIYVAV